MNHKDVLPCTRAFSFTYVLMCYLPSGSFQRYGSFSKIFHSCKTVFHTL